MKHIMTPNAVDISRMPAVMMTQEAKILGERREESISRYESVTVREYGQEVGPK